MLHRQRGFSYELDWKEAFEKAGCRVTGELREVDAEGYVLLQGLSANGNEMAETEKHVGWLSKKKCKKLMMVVNEHKCIDHRRRFCASNGVTVGSQSDRAIAWKDWIWTPAGMNPDVYFEKVKRVDRVEKMGFRGNPYGSHQGKVDGKRNDIVNYFSKWFPEVKPGAQYFIKDRPGYVGFLNSIKATPSTEGGQVELKILLHRHLDAIGCKVVNVMYPGRFNGVLDESNYIKLELDHSNMREVFDKIDDETYCEELAQRTREKMLDTNTTHLGVKRILEWLTT